LFPRWCFIFCAPTLKLTLTTTIENGIVPVAQLIGGQDLLLITTSIAEVIHQRRFKEETVTFEKVYLKTFPEDPTPEQRYLIFKGQDEEGNCRTYYNKLRYEADAVIANVGLFYFGNLSFSSGECTGDPCSGCELKTDEYGREYCECWRESSGLCNHSTGGPTPE